MKDIKGWSASVITAMLCVTILIVLILLHQKYTTKIRVSLHGNIYSLEVANTESAREKGLSNRSNIPKQDGMLFVFSESAKHCFWMKDTLVPLDMIWLNQQKQIVFIASNVQPESYPHTICPDKTDNYVIELNAGQSTYSKLHLGDSINF